MLSARPSPSARARPGRGPRIGRPVVVLWVALAACGTALAIAARGAGPLPGDLLVTKVLQGLPAPGVAETLLYNADLAVWSVLATALAVALLLTAVCISSEPT